MASKKSINKMLLLVFMFLHKMQCLQMLLEKMFSGKLCPVDLSKQQLKTQRTHGTDILHMHTEVVRQMVIGCWMNQTVRVIFKCNGAVNDSVLLECYRILHKLQSMYYQSVWQTEESIFLVSVGVRSAPPHQSFVLKLFSVFSLTWLDSLVVRI